MRRGFTLVELLVAMTIMVILTALVLGAFAQSDEDRIAAAARLVQSSIEGAKSRAVSDSNIRGVRFQPSANDPRICDSIVYVGANDYVTGSLADIRVNINDPTDPGDDFWEIQSANAGYWDRLFVRDLILVGTRVEIPHGSGTWYVLSADNFDPAGDVLSLSMHYEPSRWVSDSSIAQGGRYDVPYHRDPLTGLLTDPVEYRMELEPTILPNSSAMSLPRGIVIDMDASAVPVEWGTGHWQVMFGPQGKPSDYFGLINLYVTRIADVELTRGMFPDHPANGTATPMTTPIVPGNAPSVPAEEPYIVTIFGQAGLSISSRADLTDADSDLRADDPFSYARRGREAQ